MKFFIIHGTDGSPEGNWFPWLKKELEGQGHTVFVPRFPTPDNQSLDTWLATFAEFESQVDDQTVFIAHSLGPAFVLSLLEQIKGHVKGCVFVSSFIGKFGGEYADEWFDERNRNFAEKSFDWKKIRESCKQFILISSDDDPYVPPEKVQELSKLLGVEPIIHPGGKHLNAEFGFTKFPFILKYVEQLTN